MKELKIINLYFYFTVFQYFFIQNNFFIFVLYGKTIAWYAAIKVLMF
jgi:hypothetical protein